MSSNVPIVSVNIAGGLGNQMFQLASAYAYSKKYSGQLCVLKYKPTNDGRPLYWDSVLRNFNPYLVDTLPNNLEQWHETQATEYNQIPSLTSNGIYLNGYLQSPKYFNNVEEIRELFKPSSEMLEYINEKYNYLLENRERVIVVHARRTDYLKDDYIIKFHGPLTVDYYKEAIKRMCQNVNNPILLLSSDDSQFWKDISKDIPELNIAYIVNDNEINTLTLLQQFKYYIIANSTFSWWAAWLANAKKVIAPSKWFGPYGPKKYSDIYVPSWELI